MVELILTYTKITLDDDIVYSVWKHTAGIIPEEEIAILLEYKVAL